MKRTAPLVSLFVLLAGGCSVGSKLDKIDAELAEVADLVCSCDVLYPTAFPDEAACKSTFGSPFDFVERDCFEDALNEDKKASRETLDCFLDIMEGYSECARSVFSCTEAVDPAPCNEMLAGIETCPQFTAPVQTKLQTCPNIDL